MEEAKFDLGIIGLGIMGENLLLNFAGKGYSVVGYDKDMTKIANFRERINPEIPTQAGDVAAADNLKEMIHALKTPSIILISVPAGPTVDSVLLDLLPLLGPGDIIIDGGNSHPADTERRAEELEDFGVNLIDMGISGGEMGARFGPSLMVGGPQPAFETVQEKLQAVAAKYNGDPCVAYLGPTSAGHYVKMVHNGIEYGLMQLIAEAYDLMKRGLKMPTNDIQTVFEEWNQTELKSYLIQITAEIFSRQEGASGERLIDLILGEAGQKGTGKWAVQEAMELNVAVPNMAAGVDMRNVSTKTANRVAIKELLPGPVGEIDVEAKIFIEQLQRALFAGFLLTYFQGFAQLAAASLYYENALKQREAARIWRAGCIIQADAIETIRAGLEKQPELQNLLMDEGLSRLVAERHTDLRIVVQKAVQAGIPVPGYMAALGYYDAYRSEWLPANLIQAQRDYYGSHLYQRTDIEGTHHTAWTTK